MINVQKVAADAAADASLVNELASLVNSVYAIAEDGLWTAGTSRTTPERIAQSIAVGQIAVAIASGQIVGVVTSAGWKPARANSGCWSPTPLTAARASAASSSGSPSAGVAGRASTPCSSRSWCRGSGRHPSKEFLKAWYSRIGYRPVRTGQFEESYPELAPQFATPCDFVIYHKPLPAFEHALVSHEKR